MARTIKTADEITDLRIASQRTGKAIIGVLKWFKWHPNISERDASACFRYSGRLLGCPRLSFITIAAQGTNAAYLHYTLERDLIQQKNLVLLDCGLLYNGYSGDITRVFPASGRFSPEQRTVYNLLLEKQIQLIEMVKPGLCINDLNTALCQKIFEVVLALGLVPPGTEYSREIARVFCPHGISHHIGCNVHDLCGYKPKDQELRIQDLAASAKPFEPGMVISIEPGVYFHPKKLAALKAEPPCDVIDIPKALEFAETVGGIRIEDDVLVTETGFENLSAICPKTIEEIEALMNS
jgi:Xaa-Pro aminopeptidase